MKITKIFLILILTFRIQNIFAQNEDEFLKMSLRELMDLKVVTASNSSEKISDAPATVIVLTQKDIKERGYTELSEMFDDLPGMDVVHTYGDYYLQNYWRGFRTTYSSSWLLMVDGLIFNNLYFNSAANIVTLPLSNIERIEIVYGPASSVYGANASMGVVNVITLKDREQNGTKFSSIISGGSNENKAFDFDCFYRHDELRISFSSRFDNRNRDVQHLDMYEWTKSKYYYDTKLWGKMTQNPSFASEGFLPNRKYSLNLQAIYDNTELVFQYNTLDVCYGLTYPTDKEASSSWKQYEYSVHLAHKQPLNNYLSSNTLVRFRQSGPSNDSYDITGYENSNGVRQMYFDYYESTNFAYIAEQNFSIELDSLVSLNTGVTYTLKNLQRAYNNPFGEIVEPGQFDPDTYKFPILPQSGLDPWNRVINENKGVFLQSKIELPQISEKNNNILNIGIRLDENSFYGSATTLRLGYMGTFDKLGIKALYGESFQEPTPRNLYGGWLASGHNEDLKPELSNTYEINGSYTISDFTTRLSGYYVNVKNAFVNFAGGAKNFGERKVYGLDYFAQYQQYFGSYKINFYGYYSFISGKEKRFQESNGIVIKDSMGVIGDLAPHKFIFGITTSYKDKISLNLRGRIISERETVITNPLRKIPGYNVWDMNLNLNNLLSEGIGISLKVTNLFDAEYAQPGVSTADAGNSSGYWDSQNKWHGSQGWFNSELPQPGRLIQLSLRVDY